MIYCNPTFIQNRLDMVRLREKGYDVWIASYGVSNYQYPYPVKYGSTHPKEVYQVLWVTWI